jgi:glycosyltransferase 2 family protein
LEEGKKRRKLISNILKIVISLGVLAVIISRVDLRQTAEHLAQMDWRPFLAAMALYLAGVLVRAYRWGVLVWALGVHVSWWRLVALYFVGAFFSQFLPTGVGGDAVRVYELAQDSKQTAAVISSVLVDRFLGLFFLFAMALVALAAGWEMVPPQVRILIAVVFVASAIGVALLLQRTWIERWGRRLGLGRLVGRIKILRELYESVHLYGWAALAKASTASIVFNLMLIVAYYLLGLAVGIDQPLWIYFLFVPIISALLLVPSVGGFGIREGGTVLLFAQVGVDDVHALALAAAYDIGVLFTGLIGVIIYVIQSIREARK